MKRPAVLLATGLGVLLAGGCASAARSTLPPAASTTTTTTIPWRAPTGAVDQVVLTADGTDRYDVTAARPGTIEVTAPESNQGTNLRLVAWQPDRPASVDQQQCATWPSVVDLSVVGLPGLKGNPGIWQPGIALRIVSNQTATKAIAISQNVWAGGVWEFWVQLWDTGTAAKMHATTVFDARSALAMSIGPDGLPDRLRPPPWHVCARVVGARLDFKIWTGNKAEPTYDDRRHAFHLRLPTEWVYAGYPGSYAGHVRPGKTVRFGQITVAPVDNRSEHPVLPGEVRRRGTE